MSLTDAFGPPPKKGSDAAAIQWCRSSIYARLGPGHAHRSPLSIALLYAAELAVRVADEDLPRDRRRKLEAARAALEKLSHAEVMSTLQTVRESIEGAPGEPERLWGRRVEVVLCELARASAPPDVAAVLERQEAEKWAAVDAKHAATMARVAELVAGGMDNVDAQMKVAAEMGLVGKENG